MDLGFKWYQQFRQSRDDRRHGRPLQRRPRPALPQQVADLTKKLRIFAPVFNRILWAAAVEDFKRNLAVGQPRVRQFACSKLENGDERSRSRQRVTLRTINVVEE